MIHFIFALVEYWLQHYEPRSYVLILDFRDTFFQANPMGEHPPFPERVPTYDLRVFAENFKVGLMRCAARQAFIVIILRNAGQADRKLRFQ